MPTQSQSQPAPEPTPAPEPQPVITPETTEKIPEEDITVPRAGALIDNAVLKPDVDIDNSDVIVKPGLEEPAESKTSQTQNPPKSPTKPVNNSIIELANNPDFSVATIAKEANRINNKGKGEIFVSLH